MAELRCKVEVQSVDKVETLIHLLQKYRKQLPSELIKSLNNLADCDACEITRDEVRKIEGEFYSSESSVVSVNHILKRLKLCDGTYLYPKSYRLAVGDKVLAEW